ncbi:MAG: hypothetical protein JNL41_06785 [Phenylobacterium sp.]|uniref:hypothetical protein n=1 Tax=Phenylobacterium sp. TaxID=1871053 RepID=UPI001A5D5BE8|nr:hypothetical protein [Phenylobacterium sp.]MBL8553967.1 hypothetical protein [Phenylobacterium sp.]
MTMRPEIRFSSAFPDDSVEDEGDFVQWPGRNVADALKHALEEKGYRVSDPVDAQHVGWELDIWRGRKRLWLQISLGDTDENYLIAQNMTFFLWPDAELFRSFLSDLQGILEADDRFSRIRWFPKGGRDRDVAGASGPFDP